jgi:hypothetical protein
LSDKKVSLVDLDKALKAAEMSVEDRFQVKTALSKAGIL